MRAPLCEAVVQAAAVVAPFIRRTPSLRSERLSALVNADVYLKFEHLQTTGSFKIRGATNKLLALTEASLKSGVIAASTGNHGVAVARCARVLGGHAIIYVPETADPTKVRKIRDEGAEIRPFGTDAIESEQEARRVSKQEEREYISPYNDYDVIAGQGTIGVELLQQIPDLERVYVSVGGGGLISGIGSYLKDVRPDVQVIAVSPHNSAVMHQSVRAGKIVEIPYKATLSDGTAGGVEADAVTFDLCRQFVDKWILVDENAIVQALKLLLQDIQTLVEGSAAMAVAGLIHDSDNVSGQTSAVILCGGNVNETAMKAIIAGCT